MPLYGWPQNMQLFNDCPFTKVCMDMVNAVSYLNIPIQANVSHVYLLAREGSAASHPAWS